MIFLAFQLVAEQQECSGGDWVGDCDHPDVESCAYSCKNVSTVFTYARQETDRLNCYCFYGVSGDSCTQVYHADYNLYKFSSNELLAAPKSKSPSE